MGFLHPIYQTTTDRLYDDGYGIRETRYFPKGAKDIPQKIGVRVDVARLKREYERLSAFTPEQAVAEYKSKKTNSPGRRVNPDNVTELISTLDERGAWVRNISVWDWNLVRVVSKSAKSDRVKTIRGISTVTFIRNMRTFINYLERIKE